MKRILSSLLVATGGKVGGNGRGRYFGRLGVEL